MQAGSLRYVQARCLRYEGGVAAMIEGSESALSAAGPVGVGVIGLGFMGRTHIAAYQSARRGGYPCRLVAVCDRHDERLAARFDAGGNIATSAGTPPFDPAEVRGYAAADELLADLQVDLVSICTPTDTHVELAIAALAAGKHVLVEKPVALGAGDIERVAQAAATAKRVCLPAMCMRFWPGWPGLKQAIEDGRYGAVRIAEFQRMGSMPTWSTFYADAERSGGALVDLHVHDVDFVRWCFGDPGAVSSEGHVHHVRTQYRYAHGSPALVTAEGGWIPGQRFRMHYRVEFERATADFEWGRAPPLLLTRAGGSAEAVPLESLSAYDLEIRHVLDVANGDQAPAVTLADAAAAARILEAERESMLTGALVRL